MTSNITMHSAQCDRDQAVDGSLGGQATGGAQGVQAVDRELAGGDIIADVRGLRGFADEVTHKGVQVLLCTGDVLAPVHQRREFGVLGVLLGDVRIGVEDGFELFTRGACLVADEDQVFEVRGHVAFVPRGQDRLDVREVLVQRRPADAGLFRDLRHRHRRQSVLGHQRRGGLQSRLADRAAVLGDRLIPQLRHPRSVRDDDI